MTLSVCASWNRCVDDSRSYCFVPAFPFRCVSGSYRASFAHAAPIHEGSHDIICELRCLEYAVCNKYVSRCSTRQAMMSCSLIYGFCLRLIPPLED